MSIIERYQGLRPFATREEIIDTLLGSKFAARLNLDSTAPKAVQLMDNSKQRTYLISAGDRIFKVLDDRRKPKPSLKWSRSKEKIFDHGRPRVTVERYSDRSAQLSFDALPERQNLVTKALFRNLSLESALRSLVDGESEAVKNVLAPPSPSRLLDVEG